MLSAVLSPDGRTVRERMSSVSLNRPSRMYCRPSTTSAMFATDCNSHCLLCETISRRIHGLLPRKNVVEDQGNFLIPVGESYHVFSLARGRASKRCCGRCQLWSRHDR